MANKCLLEQFHIERSINTNLLFTISQVVIIERNRIRRFCCWETESAAYSIYSASFLITTWLSWFTVCCGCGDGSGLGGSDCVSDPGETGGVRPSWIWSSETSFDNTSVCFTSLWFCWWRALFLENKRKLSMSVIHYWLQFTTDFKKRVAFASFGRECVHIYIWHFVHLLFVPSFTPSWYATRYTSLHTRNFNITTTE